MERMKHLEKELEKSVGEIIIDLQTKNRDLERELENIRELSRQQGKAFDECLKDYRGLVKDYMKQEEENKKLKEMSGKLGEMNGKLGKRVNNLEEENKKLREELGEYKKMFEDHLKECYIKNTAEFLDKKFPKINGFMEEDTLQELRDLGKI